MEKFDFIGDLPKKVLAPKSLSTLAQHLPTGNMLSDCFHYEFERVLSSREIESIFINFIVVRANNMLLYAEM